MLTSALILFLIVCAVLGFITGFVWQAIRLLSVVVSLVGAFIFMGPVDTALAKTNTSLGWGQSFIVPLAVFILILLACYVLSYLFHDAIDAFTPKRMDRFSGAFLGMVKGALVAGLVLLLAVQNIDEETRAGHILADCTLARGAAYTTYQVGSVIRFVLPGRLKRRIPRYLGGGGFDWPQVRPTDNEAAAQGTDSPLQLATPS